MDSHGNLVTRLSRTVTAPEPPRYRFGVPMGCYIAHAMVWRRRLAFLAMGQAHSGAVSVASPAALLLLRCRPSGGHPRKLRHRHSGGPSRKQSHPVVAVPTRWLLERDDGRKLCSEGETPGSATKVVVRRRSASLNRSM
jgi:hypothetical protein